MRNRKAAMRLITQSSKQPALAVWSCLSRRRAERAPERINTVYQLMQQESYTTVKGRVLHKAF
jgi:hypothetical protein